ncbi:cysteine hydrolase family protein [Shewanella mangrovisoli]|uniref:cysteine hydrolase family protein n=1 Tax=Shewanella mangrovisoli TaxID=2864211 RepID=UPI0035BA7A68
MSSLNKIPANSALVIIDVQNDYFAHGAYPQWQVDEALARTLYSVQRAQQQAIPIILVQHIADTTQGEAPFFNPNTQGVEIHPALLAELPNAPIVVKQFADSFDGTELANLLQGMQIKHLLLCGIMTQNCVTHTALSPAAQAYSVQVIADACTAPTQMVHHISLSALSRRVALINSQDL